MRLEASVLIRRTPEDVWAYLGDLSNVSKWDRGVAQVQQTSATSPGVGLEFDTLAHPKREGDGNWGRMSYRISEADPARGCTVKLTSSGGNARYFRTAEWRFRVDATAQGAKVFCAVQFKLRFPFVIFAPVFYCMKGAIRSDLENLRHVLENGQI